VTGLMGENSSDNTPMPLTVNVSGELRIG